MDYETDDRWMPDKMNQKEKKVSFIQENNMKWHIVIQITEEDKKCIKKMVIDSNKGLAEWIGTVLMDKVKEGNNNLLKDIKVFAGRK